jgi:hypothetical protein
MGLWGLMVPLVLDLDATELSWVVVQVDSGSPQEALLRPGREGAVEGAGSVYRHPWVTRVEYVLS